MSALSDFITALTLELLQRQRSNTTEQPLVVSLPLMIAALQEIEGGIGAGISISQNGNLLSAGATSIDFTGSLVGGSAVGDAVTITNAAHAIAVSANGVLLSSDVDSFDFTGSLISGVAVGDDVEIETADPVSALSSMFVSNGRLTLTSGVPVLSTDVIDSDDIYFTPFNGNLIMIYDGSSVVAHTFTEINLDITPLAADTTYDIFIWDNGGTLELIAVAWASGTARAETVHRATTGFLTNETAITSGPAADRGTLLGTIDTDSNGQLNMMFNPAAASGGAGNRLDVFNVYNRVDVSSNNIDNATNYAYKVGLREKNNSANNRIRFVCGIAEDEFTAINTNEATISATTTVGNAPIGYDATNAIASGCVSNMGQPPGGGNACFNASLRRMPEIGRHYVTPLEEGNNGAGTMTWQTQTGGAGFQVRSGFTFNWRM